MSRRTITEGRACVTSDFDVNAPIAAWLEGFAADERFTYLLAHSEFAVVWGRKSGATWVTGLPLDWTRVTQVRLFGPQAELLAWRADVDSGSVWRAVRFEDGPGVAGTVAFTAWIDEDYMLWGNSGVTGADGFTTMRDGAQGLEHRVPLVIDFPDDKDARPLRLRARHYLAETESGVTRIAASRLVGLGIAGK